MPEMTTDQALQMLDHAVSTLLVTREQHNALQQALSTLATALAPKPKTEDPKKKK